MTNQNQEHEVLDASFPDFNKFDETGEELSQNLEVDDNGQLDFFGHQGLFNKKTVINNTNRYNTAEVDEDEIDLDFNNMLND